MKKSLKFFLLFPIIILTLVFSFGCGCNEDALTKISLSLSEYQLVDGFYRIDKTDKNITIDVKITPNKYSVDSLEWSSNATNVVTVNKNTFKTRGAGKATITASYKNSSGDVVKATLKVWVSADSEVMGFTSSLYNTTYKGEDIKDNFKILQDTGKGDYVYSYFSFNEGRFLRSEEGIIDVGEYQIICSKANNEDIYCSTKLIINKKELTIDNSGNFEITYGNELPSKLKIISDIKTPLKNFDESEVEAVKGIGCDNVVIGRYIYTLPEGTILNANFYQTNLYFEFEDGFSKNYKIPENKVGQLKVKSREVVLKINEDLSAIYGYDFTPQYEIFNYTDYVNNQNSVDGLNPLTDLNEEDSSIKVNFKDNINLNSPTYYKEGNLVSLNEVNCIPVLYNSRGECDSYEINYNQADVKNNNLLIKNVLSGKITINPRNISILPNKNQSKVFSTADKDITYNYVNSGIVNGEKINKFLFVDYIEEDYCKLNLNAVIGSYYYKIVERDDNGNLLNPNYSISLDERAVKSQIEEENLTKIKFNVVACNIEVEFESLTTNYKKPKDNDKYTISYFGETDFKTNIKSLKINNKNLDLTNLDSYYKDETQYKAWDGCFRIYFDINGNINLLSYDESLSNDNNGFELKIKFTDLKLQTIEEDKLTYEIFTSSFSVDCGADNFDFKLIEDTFIKLNKIILKIVPKETEGVVNKIYGQGTSADFSKDYNVEGFENGGNLRDIIANYASLLSLTNSDNKYYNTITKTYFEDTSAKGPQDVGKYQIFMNTPTYYDNMEHYEVVFDTSKIYEFTISPCVLIVTPDSGLGKTYGEYDPVIIENKIIDNQEVEIVKSGLTYKVKDEFGSILSLTSQGDLSRVYGEDVGLYKINLGSLNFGSNYEVKLDEAEVFFEIRKRKVTITPNSMIVSYGDVFNIGYTSEIENGEGEETKFSESILVYPTFTGSFSLKDANTVGGYYPVKADSEGNVESYEIIQGTFNCNGNYYIEFNTNGRYTINKKEILCNIDTQNIDNKDNLSNEISLNETEINYTILDPLTGSSINNITFNAILTLDLSNDYYVSCDIKEKSIYPAYVDKDIEITDCYNVKLGNSIIYNIGITILNFEIVYSDEYSTTNSVEKVYNAVEFSDFKLVCTNSGYEIDYDNSSYSIVYQKGNKTTTSALNVGNYVVKVNLGSQGKIVVVKGQHECNADCSNPCDVIKKIEFSSLEEQIIDNHLLSISDYGYLNIKKANINYNPNVRIAFTGEFKYGDSKLNNIETEDENGDPIFKDVNGNELELKNFEINGESLNFSYSPNLYQLSKLNANTSYPINIVIQDESGNYNTLKTNAYLDIIPRPLEVETEIYTSKELAEFSKVKYNGKYHNYTFKPSASYYLGESKIDVSNEIVVRHIYKKFEVEYINGEAFAVCYPVGESGTDFTKKNLKDVNELLQYNGIIEISGDYAFVEGMAIKLTSMNLSPVNAGLYMGLYKFECSNNYSLENSSLVIRDDNYIYSDLEDVDITGELYMLYQIKKSDEIDVAWKEEYYYTTVFNLTDKDKIPFEYSLTPHFDEVEFTMQQPSASDWPANNILDVGDYSVNICVDSENFYLSVKKDFKVIPLLADFVFPSAITYVYTGSPVDSFLRNIKVNQRDINGEIINSFFYQKGVYDDVISLTYYEYDGENWIEYDDGDDDQIIAPDKVGTYKLHIKYESKLADTNTNFEGEGYFEYSIVKKSYTGALSFSNKQIDYSPNITREYLYNIIRNEMYSISLINYEVSFVFVEADGDRHDIKIEQTEDKDWFYYFVQDPTQNTQQRKIIAITKFEDDYADKEVEATLTFKTYKIDKSKFVQENNISNKYDYTGYAYCNALVYKGDNNIDILLKLFDEEQLENSSTITNKVKEYVFDGVTYYTLSQVDNNVCKLMLRDVLGNMVFTLSYSFERRVDGSDDMVPYAFVPRDPGEYTTKYSIIYGNFYSGIGNAIPDNTFYIKPVTVNINSKISSKIEFVYDAGDKTQLALSNLIVNNNSSGTTTNMKLKLLNSNVEFDNIYGVHIRYNLYDSKDNNIEKAIDAGEYYIKVTLLISMDYLLSDYFNYVNYAGNKTIITDYNPQNYNEAYSSNSSSITIRFKINPKPIEKPCIISADNYENIIAGETIISEAILGVKKLHIEDINGNIVGLSSTIPSDWRGYDFAGLEGVYYIVCEIDTRNCYFLGEFDGRLQITVVIPEDV